MKTWSSPFPQSCNARPTDISGGPVTHGTSVHAPTSGTPDSFHGSPWPWKSWTSKLPNIYTNCALTQTLRESKITLGIGALNPMRVTWRANGKNPFAHSWANKARFIAKKQKKHRNPRKLEPFATKLLSGRLQCAPHKTLRCQVGMPPCARAKRQRRLRQPS